jgi:anti-sigma factor RsiW
MNDHIAAEQLTALADGELHGDDLFEAQEHLAECAACTSAALAASLTKGAMARVGMRYAVPDEFQERMRRLAAGESAVAKKTAGFSVYAWGPIAALLVLGVGLFVAQRQMQGRNAASELVAEVADQHIAVMAANAPPQVISSDRHTVKPWFQGKLPFSFNLPQNLPGDTTLDGADLTYLHGQPAAQLLYSIGKHHVSVFVQQRSQGSSLHFEGSERSGFHVMSVSSSELTLVGVSDVDPARLGALLNVIYAAQGPSN